MEAKTRKIYNYHPDTKVYLGSSDADENPLEEGKFLIPAHATVIEPPVAVTGKATKFIDGIWLQAEAEKPVAEVLTDAQLESAARSKRSSLLFQSDYTQLSDSPVTNAADWKTYRQALRDLTKQTGFPKTIEWPTKPN